MRERPILSAGQLLLELESALELLRQANRYVVIDPGIGAQQLSIRITEHIALSHAYVGDEREAFEAWMHTFDMPPQLEGEVFLDEQFIDADCYGQFVYEDHSTQRCWAAWQSRAALTALPAAGVPDGWKLVPVRPTDEMVIAFAEQWYSKRQAIDSPDMADAYASMLAAAPDAPENAKAARIAELEAAFKRAEQVINRECQAAAAYRMQALELERECKRLRERLEINEQCPYDGIATRDAAMKFMTQEINSLRSKLENVSEEHDKAWRRAEASEQNLLALTAAFTAPPAAVVPEGFVDVMAAVFRELEHRHGDERGNAPRHSHTIPGVWDEDNGELAGKPCAWCALWNKGKEMLKAASAPGHHNDTADSPRSSK